MLLKDADDRTQDLEILGRLMKDSNTPDATKRKIEREIANIRSGIKGEKEAAYEIDAAFRTRNWFVIHDLRIEHEGLVAQIDHLLIDRFLNIYLCESKRFGEGVAVNDQGEFSAFFNGRPYGIPSPIEQNRRHITILERLFSTDAIEWPRRLGFKIKPDMRSYVLVSKNARISRPKNAKIDGLDSVVKTDQFVSKLLKDGESDSPLSMMKVVSQDTLEALARQIMVLHRPITFKWAEKFGLTAEGTKEERAIEEPADIPVEEDRTAETTEDKAAVPQATEEGTTKTKAAETPEANQKKKLQCSQCEAAVSYAVAKFCWNNKKLGGKVLCMSCQKG